MKKKTATYIAATQELHEQLAELRAEVFAANHKLSKHRAANKMLEETIARQAKVIGKLRNKLEEIRWSWANDAGRQCDNLAFEALTAIENGKAES